LAGRQWNIGKRLEQALDDVAIELKNEIILRYDFVQVLAQDLSAELLQPMAR